MNSAGQLRSKGALRERNGDREIEKVTEKEKEI